MMLSATMGEYAPFEIQVVRFGLEVAPDSVSEVRGVDLATLREGGYIIHRSTTIDANAGGHFIHSATAHATDVGDDMVFDKTGPPELEADQTWQLFDADAIPGGGIQPIPFASDEYNSELQPSISQGLTEYSPVDNVSSEGGAIPIDPILSHHEPASSVHLRVDVLATTAPGRATLIKDFEPSHSPSSQSHSAIQATNISGELARAIVFETAGGEPEVFAPPAAEAPTPADDFSTERAAAPLSAAEFDPEYEPGDAERPTTAANLPERRQKHANVPGVSESAGNKVHTATLQLGMNQMSPVSTPTWAIVDRGDDKRTVGILPRDSGVSGKHNDATEDSVSLLDRLRQDALRHSVGATPLLMILALERIASSNSRRAHHGSIDGKTPNPTATSICGRSDRRGDT
jgi:hypothetical protein